MDKKERALKIYYLLKKEYGSVPRLFLNYKTRAQMLAAIILSAQSTDSQINKLTSKLFSKYTTIDDFAKANRKQFEKEIFSSGFYKTKTKKIIACFKMINSKFCGKIPENIDELVLLPGVGRKTANLVLASVGKIEGIAVDTHVARLSYRFGLTKYKDAKKIELDLMKIYPKQKWIEINGLFISHGRVICVAKKPNCSKCILNKKNICLRVGVNVYT
jgi:endonuclease III